MIAQHEFLSEEDLDLANLSWEELLVVWNHWLAQAQATNEEDRFLYEHGVFEREPEAARTPASPHGRGCAPCIEHRAQESDR